MRNLVVDRSVKETYDNGATLPCPHCGHKITDLWDYGLHKDDAHTVIQCGECNGYLELRLHIQYMYTGAAMKPLSTPATNPGTFASLPSVPAPPDDSHLSEPSCTDTPSDTGTQ